MKFSVKPLENSKFECGITYEGFDNMEPTRNGLIDLRLGQTNNQKVYWTFW